MKTNKIILAGLMAVATFFAACTENAPEYVPGAAETNNVHAYFAADNVSAVEVSPNESFDVVICRENVAEALSFDITYTESHEGAFKVVPTVTFAAGDSVATVSVTLNSGVVALGEVATINLVLPASVATVYSVNALGEFAVNVTAGYMWVTDGTALFTSGLCSAGFGQTMTAEVEVQRASDYTNADGDKLYRLVSPYYLVSQGILCTVPGWHLPFILDKDNNPKALNIPQGLYQIFDTDLLSGIMYMDWDLEEYAAYNVFFNQGDIYCIQTVMSDGATPYGPYQEYWQWTPAN